MTVERLAGGYLPPTRYQRSAALFGPGRLEDADTVPLPPIQAYVPVVPAPTNPVPPTTAVGRDPLAIIRRVQDGDSEAFGELFDHYHAEVYRYIRFRIGHQQTTEDLTDETFLRALKSIDRFTWQGRDPGAWLVTIARNLIADHAKSARMRYEVYTNDDDHSSFDKEAHGVGVDPEATVVDQITARQLREAVGTLKLEQREVIVLRFLEDRSVAETAEALGKTPGAVKALQYRGLLALDRLLPNWMRP